MNSSALAVWAAQGSKKKNEYFWANFDVGFFNFLWAIKKLTNEFSVRTKMFFNPIPNRLGHLTYNERADSALTW